MIRPDLGRRVRRTVRGIVVVGTFAAASCTPGGSPTPSPWLRQGDVQVLRVETDQPVPDAAVGEDWGAFVDPPSSTLRVYPRLEPDGVLADSARTFPIQRHGRLLRGGVGEHVIGIWADGGPLEVVAEIAGTWRSFGSVAVPPGFSPFAIDDRWLVLRGGGEAPVVRMAELDLSGGTVRLRATTDLTPVLPIAGGRGIDLDGDAVAVASSSGPGAGTVRVYRATDSGWGQVATVEATPGVVAFAHGLALDGNDSRLRLVLASTTTDDVGGRLDVYADSGQGLVHEDTVHVRAPNHFLGQPVDLDGDRMAVVTATGNQVELFQHRDGAWAVARRVDLDPWPTRPDDPSRFAMVVRVTGERVAAEVWTATGPCDVEGCASTSIGPWFVNGPWGS